VEAATAQVLGNAASVGTGLWTLVAFQNINMIRNYMVTLLGYGMCIPLDMAMEFAFWHQLLILQLQNQTPPTTATVGSDQYYVRELPLQTFQVNTATVGTGLWTLVEWFRTITPHAKFASGVTHFCGYRTCFRWTIPAIEWRINIQYETSCGSRCSITKLPPQTFRVLNTVGVGIMDFG
jgi:hypothetical protein